MTFPKSKYVCFYYLLPYYMNINVTCGILISETISQWILITRKAGFQTNTKDSGYSV